MTCKQWAHAAGSSSWRALLNYSGGGLESAPGAAKARLLPGSSHDGDSDHGGDALCVVFPVQIAHGRGKDEHAHEHENW